MSILKAFGWSNYFEENFQSLKSKDFACGRVIIENKTNYLVVTEFGEVQAEVNGKLLFESESGLSLPKVGDWVTLMLYDENTKGIIHEVLPRQTKISRKSVDKKLAEQVIAANIDVALIVMSLDDNYNLNRLERYLVSVLESNVEPVIVLNKTDLCDNSEIKITEVQKLAGEFKVIGLSVITKTGFDDFKKIFQPGITYVFIGSSGVGKSTIINYLLGEEKFKTNEVRIFDSKGRHTTTKREMVLLSQGGVLIDTPGMKQFGLWTASSGIAKTFSSFEDFASTCKYADCTHTHENECGIKDAVAAGVISEKRYENYTKLRKELDYVERQNDLTKQIEFKKKWKSISKEQKSFSKRRGY
ncbi:MAG: ribosome small subunit-dependent GTPase A [bacterium]